MITYKEIDEAIVYFENKNFSEESEKEFIGKYPVIQSYLTSNQYKMLSDDEYLLFFFDALVLLKAFEIKMPEMGDLQSDIIEQKETVIWDKYETLSSKNFEDKVISLFENKNSDVSDFILLGVEDEEEDISQPAKEIIVISLKTLFDCMVEEAS